MSRLRVCVAKDFPGFSLDVSWDAGDGVTVLFAPSGAGKTLTLSMIAGLVVPDRGVVRLGDDVLSDTTGGTWVPPQRRGIGYVSQTSELFPHMSVAGNVEYGLPGMPKAARRRRAAHMLAALGIEALADRRPAEISGGQSQRVALARALARTPRLLLLDEPFSALDLPVRLEMRTLLRTVRRDFGVPIVLVTHDLNEALELADTLVVYSGGGAVHYGRPRDLLQDPGTPEIRRLLRDHERGRSPFSAFAPLN